jgi:hypothetical protein
MTDEPKAPPTVPLKKGHQPQRIEEGYKPQPATTGQGAPSNPPNQGSGGKK